MLNYIEPILPLDQNTRNRLNIESQIRRKQQWRPYYADVATTSAVLTDFDSFPYTRWWRGEPDYYSPIVLEREAGWRPRQDTCYFTGNCKKSVDDEPAKQACYETACSTVFPCFPKSGPKVFDREASNISSNNGKVLEYR